MSKSFQRVSITVVGPQQDRNSHDRRELSVEVELRVDDRHWGETRYYLWSSATRLSAGWGEPIGPFVEVPVYTRSIDLPFAEAAVKQLKAYQRYVQRLPVQPRTLEELVLTIGTMHGIKMATLLTAPDSYTRMDVQEWTSVAHAAWVAQEAFDRLALPD